MEPPSRRRAPSPSFLGLGFLVAVSAALLLRLPFKKPVQPKLWTVEELALYNGTDESLPILLGILGSVFDVTKGKTHYGPGGGYNHFAGRDASRAFISGNFTGDGLSDSLQGISSIEVNSVVDWQKFYFERYSFAGKLVGRYYDSHGNPTKYLKGVEAKAKRGAQLLEKQKEDEAKIPSCNSKWSQDEGGEVWCDTGYPRLVKRPSDIATTGRVSQRCACFKEEELGRPGVVRYRLSKVGEETFRYRYYWESEPAVCLFQRRGARPSRFGNIQRLQLFVESLPRLKSFASPFVLFLLFYISRGLVKYLRCCEDTSQPHIVIL